MQRLSLAIAITSALLASGCARQQTTVLQAGAEHVSMGANPAVAGAEYIGVVSASDGNGCRGHGRMGIQALAEIELRNKALAMGGDYVQITHTTQPGMNAEEVCKDNVYLLQGSVFRLPASRDAKAVAQGPLVLQPQEIAPNEPTAQPPAVKPREMRQIADRERVLPGEENWTRRRVARYVSTYSDEGRDIVAKRGREQASRDPVVSPSPMAAVPVVTPAAAPVVSAPAAVPAVAAVTPAASTSVPTPAAVAVPKITQESPPPAVVSTTPPRKQEAVIRLDAAQEQSLLPPPGSLRMPVPTLDSQPAGGVIMAASDPSLRQVTLKPRDTAAGKPAAGLSKEERDRRLEELGRDDNLSYEEYQRRYREIMGD